jgi:hypothetical protein
MSCITADLQDSWAFPRTSVQSCEEYCTPANLTKKISRRCRRDKSLSYTPQPTFTVVVQLSSQSGPSTACGLVSLLHTYDSTAGQGSHSGLPHRQQQCLRENMPFASCCSKVDGILHFSRFVVPLVRASRCVVSLEVPRFLRWLASP